jgi:hypothetical protein
MIDKLLGAFVWVWTTIIVLVYVAATVINIRADGFWGALDDLQAEMNPYNLRGWLTRLLLLSPAILTYILQQKLRLRRLAKVHPS